MQKEMALDSIVGDAVGFVLVDRVVFAVRNVVGHVVGVFVIGNDWRQS